MNNLHIIGEALCKAAEIGHKDGVLNLLGKTDPNFDNGRPLMSAVRSGHPDIIRILIEAGADIHIREEAPLRTAVYLNLVETIEILIELGADIHASDNLALRLAVEEGHLLVVECLMKNGACCQPANDNRLLSTLDVAVCAGNEPLLRVLIENGAPTGTITEASLMEAARLGRTHTFDFLLKCGVKIDTPAVRSAAQKDPLSQSWFDALDVRAGVDCSKFRKNLSIKRASI